jgi:hypothetical protein
LRERVTTAREFDPAEIHRGHHSNIAPPAVLAALPLIVVIGVNFLMAMVVLPRIDTSFLAEERWGSTSLQAVGGVWAVVIALAAAILTVIVINRRRLPALPAFAWCASGCSRSVAARWSRWPPPPTS